MLVPAVLLAGLAPGVADEIRVPLTAPRPAAPAVEMPDATELERLVRDLGADDFAVREAAAGRLRRAGAFAAEALRSAARDGDLETRTRAVSLLAESLRDAVQREDAGAAAAFADALQRLSEPPAPDTPEVAAVPADAAAAAAATLERFPASVTAMAIRAIRGLGAAVMPTNVRGLSGRRYSVTLDDRWTGGAEGLRHLRQIGGVSNVYYTDGAVTDKARRDLLAGRYGFFAVERRGKAFLGISFDTAVGEGCVIERVTVGGPADRAGLREGDQITKFGGVEVAGPQALLDAIRERGEPGAPVPVVVRRQDGRGAETLNKAVTLGRWPDGDTKFRGEDPRLIIPGGLPRRFGPPIRRPVPDLPPTAPRQDPADGGDTPD